MPPVSPLPRVPYPSSKAQLSQPPTKAGSGHFTSGPQVALGSWDIGNAQRGGPGRSGWSACSVVTPSSALLGVGGQVGSPLTLCAQRWLGLWSPGLLRGLLSWLPAGSQAVRSLAGGWRWVGLQRPWTAGVLGGSASASLPQGLQPGQGGPDAPALPDSAPCHPHDARGSRRCPTVSLSVCLSDSPFLA